MQELALEAVAARRRRSAGRRTTGWPIAAKWARIWCVRPVSSRARPACPAGSVSTHLEVGARLARRRGRRRRAARARGSRGRAARRSCPSASAAGRSTSARYSRARPRAPDQPPRARGAPRRCGRRASARRCRGRGGGRSPGAPGPRRRRAGRRGRRPASRPRWPGRGVDDEPGRLVDDRERSRRRGRAPDSLGRAGHAGRRPRRRLGERREHQQHGADRDRDVGEVERGPQRAGR